ncbi:MAG: hypothetical protein Q8S36_10890 [Sulfuricurvum sp.]|nr:hypothetical protein [Sulfuricurvum sp.]
MEKLVQFFVHKYDDARKYFAPNIPLVYANHAVSPLMPLDKTAALIFPPSDYWVMHVNLNAKNEKDASKYGPALFDLGGSYRYEAQKVGENSYVLLAYEPDVLSQKLLSYPDLSMIDKFTFAQWVFDKETLPIRLNDKKYLTILEGIVVEIDQSYLEKSVCVEINDVLSRPNAFFKTLGLEGLVTSEITHKTLRKTFIILCILFGNFTALAYFSHQESSQAAERMQKMLTTANLPETSIERDAILASLRIKEKKQLDLRHQCYKISSLPIDVKPPLADIVPKPSAPSLPSLPPVLGASANAASNGIVLIPGSNPGEQNQLLVEKTSSPANNILSADDGIEELVYDGHAINIIINTSDAATKAKLKSELTKQFKNAQLSDHNRQLEVRLK